MLFLIGLGLDSKDISVKSLHAIKESDELFLETYTSFIPKGYIEYIQKEAGKKVSGLGRQDLEENVKVTVSKAKERNIALLVPGDPLIATTHHIVINAAKAMGIKVVVYHSASVFTSAIGESGLDIYRFGPTTTIPFWFENYKPTSFLDVINKNLKNKEHTLVLLDIDHKNQKPMSMNEAIEILRKAEEERRTGVIRDDLKMIVLASIGRDDQKIICTELKNMTGSTKIKLSGKIISLIIPAHLNFAEEENLKSVASA